MHIIVSTPKGKLYDEDVDYIVVKNNEGEYAIMNNHIPDLCIIPEGYIKMVKDKLEYYIVVINGILEYKNMVANVLAQDAHIGKTQKEAKESIEEIRRMRLAENKKISVAVTEQEKELAVNIKKSKAGRL